MTVTVYYTSVTASREIDKNQRRIFSILDSKSISYEKLDISEGDTKYKDKMREIANDPKALPPQITNGDQYCGNFASFDEAVECGTLEQFLKI